MRLPYGKRQRAYMECGDIARSAFTALGQRQYSAYVHLPRGSRGNLTYGRKADAKRELPARVLRTVSPNEKAAKITS